MEDVRNSTRKFLEKHAMHPESVDLDRELEVFVKDMEAGLSGAAPSTLAMLTTYVSPDAPIPVNEPVIVLDGGGTNFRVALVRFDKARKPVFEHFETHPMPGTQGALDKEEFFEMMAAHIAPIAPQSRKIGFCFSFPVEMQPNKDGRILQFNKEVQVKGADGAFVGASLRDALRTVDSVGGQSVVILNDTVATLLGGKAAFPDRRFDGYVGFILGTGTNTCYAESNANLAKAPSLVGKPGTTLVNMESGGYGRVVQSPIDKAFDATLNDPGNHTFEKMISGAYQGGLLLASLRFAGREKLLAPNTADAFERLPSLESREIDDFLFRPFDPKGAIANLCGTGDSDDEKRNRAVAYHLIDAQFERAARLVAVNLAAVLAKSGRGCDPLLPACISAEGTTFHKSKLFRGKLDYYVRTWMNGKLGLHCDFVQADRATLVGTAIAGLIG